MSSNTDAPSLGLDESARFPITTWLSKQERRQPVGHLPLTFLIGVTGCLAACTTPWLPPLKHDKPTPLLRAFSVTTFVCIFRVVAPSITYFPEVKIGGPGCLLFPPPGTRKRWAHGLVESICAGATVAFIHREIFECKKVAAADLSVPRRSLAESEAVHSSSWRTTSTSLWDLPPFGPRLRCLAAGTVANPEMPT